MAARTIYRNYDQAALDAQYNNRLRFPNYVRHFEQWAEWSAKTRRTLPCSLDLAFGPDPAERLDVFPCTSEGAPLYVFIHGGYWYSLDKSDYSYVAEGMRPHGVVTAVNNFGLAPAYDMDAIVRQNRAALAWLWRHARDFGADPARIYACGHSAGGHLAAMLLATDWPALAPDLPADLVKGACAIAGLFDLEPVRLSYLNEKLHLSATQVARHSPILQRYPARAPLLLVVAADESDEFHRQSAEMAALWRSLGYPTDLIVPQDLDHFSVADQLGQADCALVRRQLADMP